MMSRRPGFALMILGALTCWILAAPALAARPQKKPAQKQTSQKPTSQKQKSASAGENSSAPNKTKRVVYKSHTELDLSGDTIQGRIRAPEVFYIFQRKRADAHHVVRPPKTFEHHNSITPSLGGQSQEAR